jgi:transposase
LKQKGWTQQDIAVALDASPGAVSQWMHAAVVGGREALRHHGSPGHPAKLTATQKRLIVDFLWHGAEAYGFRGDVWTCARVAQVIEWEFGVSYHKDHVSRLLKELDWTPQIPITRAVQRDEAAITRWRIEVWPELRRQACRERRALICVDESGIYLLPGVVRTYGPKGQTPIIGEKQTRDHLSVMAGVTPAGKLYTLVRQESLSSSHSVVFLKHLLMQTGKKLLVIWDGSPIHRWGGGARVFGRRRSAAGSFGGHAGIRSRSEPVGSGVLATSQTCGDAQPGVSGHRGVASGSPLGHRSLAAEASLDSVVLCCRRALAPRLKFSSLRSCQ